MSYKQGQQNVVDLAWVAGIIDGEGFIGIVKTKKDSCRRGFTYQVRIQVATKDSIISAECYSIFKVGSLKVTKKGALVWSVQGRQVEVILKDLLPYLRLKKNQAEICLNYLNNVTSSSGYLSDDVWEARDLMFQTCRNMKKEVYSSAVSFKNNV